MGEIKDQLFEQMIEDILGDVRGALEQEIQLPHTVELNHPIEGKNGQELKREITFRRRPCLGDIKHLDLKKPSIDDLAAVAAGMSGEHDWVLEKMDLEDAVRCGAVVMRFLPFSDRIGKLLSACLQES